MSLLKITILVPILSDPIASITGIPRDVILSITDIRAGGIFCYLAYLSTQVDNLLISKHLLKDHFNKSERKIDKSLNYLVKNKLISIETKRI